MVSNRCVPWFRSPPTRRFILWRFIPMLAALSLTWETLQLPLYTIWQTGSRGESAFAVIHCSLGDVLIGTAALLLALIATRAGSASTWPKFRVAAISVLASASYTVLSEWVNVDIRNAWAYSELMPVVPFIGTGASPLLQWFVVPPVALWLSLRRIRPYGQ